MIKLPVLDMTPFNSEDIEVTRQLGNELRHALENVGFFVIINHGISQELLESVYQESQRFFSLSEEEKMTKEFTLARPTGYRALGTSKSGASNLDSIKKPNLNESYFVNPERVTDDDGTSDLPHIAPNQWPSGLHGFRETLLEYFRVMEVLGMRMLPLFATALDLNTDYFSPFFSRPLTSLRLAHYPPMHHEEDQYGLSPHTDSGFMTLLPQSKVSGLQIRPEGSGWISPPDIPGSLIVNSGDILKRWTNDRFLSTPHLAKNITNIDRYSLPFFFDPNADALIECLHTCQNAENPPSY
ncbi:MAG: isopenicillin N synthase family oxygenase, partial [Gammaproteobacteria bacterium]|nr:isopenicillin N synthase family oxygenase [Gammaproteobacteria bacterium]